ncbi:methyltransferase-like protein 16 isoform X1 [Tripterygium wilfordii]|uniref:U6 small nuclear RNA (adenine-(43)-N(6))-methyltransferase n=1 Tax=Tripterygium wilfordii TaxID=458696 RepID=A0A7J7CV50_TRIWF|nr:U6 small nuclear RNA (adenine-(43)-N(6))-methyltransferase [Tripterygium wilfordii]KAF5737943.1 methyltransferase-like protein 16 isoform X1 [Tripterygium wilfordii]
MGGRKNKRKRAERPTIHPNNKYSDNPPDFALLASLYPSFNSFVSYSRDGRPKIDWTNFNATRELTRVLLLHDHGLNWWIPDGQLCPTVPNRSNYIHWIEDLLSSDVILKTNADGDNVKGFDIGTGANCIYPLLGASLLGWSFVGTDATEVALEWAKKNVKNNPQISELIEIREVLTSQDSNSLKESHNGESGSGESQTDLCWTVGKEGEPLPSYPFDLSSSADKSYYGPPVLLGVVKDGEKFDFCMCNPPFFETLEAAGLNPKTSCGGTPDEMVCPGGEKAFITRIIEDSVLLQQSFRWYTSMVGRKSNLKFLISKLRQVGVSIVKTTEFVQGHTCRWGLAWSFVPPARKIISPCVAQRNNLSFILEGIQRQFSAVDVLQSIESFFCSSGASCKLNTSSFTVDVTASVEHCDVILNNEASEASNGEHVLEMSYHSSHSLPALSNSSFRISVYQQIAGTLLVKGSLQHRDSPIAGAFSSVIQQLEEVLKHQFCREKGT